MKDLKIIYKKLFSHFGPQGWWPGDTSFEVSVGAILTQNTSWKNVERAIDNLKEKKLMSARALSKVPLSRLARLIRPAGYFNVKARRLRAFVDFLVGKYAGSMKRMGRGETHKLREQLLSIHGVGPETADSILLYALEKPVFVIDAYTMRVLSRHGVMEASESYGAFQGLFHESLEPDVRLYNEYHALLVAAGKHYCRPKKPLCGQCPLKEGG